MSKRLIGGALPALVLMLGLAMPAAAQDRMTTGMWTGSVFTPDGEVFDLSYDVKYEDDALAIELLLPPEAGMGNIMAGEPVFEDGTLMFTLEVGASVSCTLVGDDEGTYEGECIDETGEGAVMIMNPPEDS